MFKTDAKDVFQKNIFNIGSCIELLHTVGFNRRSKT
jgi:hypothetical protein